MLLENKNAIIYGAGGSIGGAVAVALARAGARVFLTGRNLDGIKNTANEILSFNGRVELDKVDAMDEWEVGSHIERVLQKAGSVDISFNAIGLMDTQNIALTDMLPEDFLRPVTIAMQTQFLTATAAGRAMMKQGSGIILSITSTPGGVGYPLVGGFGPACCAIEGFSRGLASELGPYGIRVVNIRSAGSPDSRPFKEAIASDPGQSAEFIRKLENDTMLKKLPMISDIANVAVFLSSEMAGKITGVTIDVTCGTTSGLNHKVAAIPLK
jgi:3-oxoacyl-[acyl-carrier protein] reductase